MWSALLVGVGLSWAAQGVIDPLRPTGRLLGPLLALLGLVLGSRTRVRWKNLLFPTILAMTFGVSAHIQTEFRADSGAYFAYLRSLVFDGDLDFANEWEHWGWEKGRRTRTGMVRNAQSVGPAVFWSPAYLATHAYLVVDRWLTGTSRYELDGYGAPYRRAAALATLILVVGGAALLVNLMTPMFGMPIALVAGVGVVLTSPVLYYALVVPTMAHGVTFGAAAALVAAWDRARRIPSLKSWTMLGAALGLVMLSRWQGALYALLILPLAVQGLVTKRVRAGWLLAAAGSTLLLFSPQLIAWKILYGRWITIPQGPGFLDFWSPNLLGPLFSADHGFFNWTPVMFVCVVGLLMGLRQSLWLFGSSLLVFAATAWVNGSVPDYDLAAGDAFGARRFSLVVPLMALGLGAFLQAATGVLRRAPLLAPTAFLLLCFLWNVGLISHFRARKYREMAPLEQLAGDQARSLRLASQEILGWVAGDRGRAFAYQLYSAEYFYTRFNRNGTIDLRSVDGKYLLEGWSTGSRRNAPRPFRRALYPEACVRIPLQEPVDLPTVITARAPEGLESQVVTVVLNGQVLTTARLPDRWREMKFTMEARYLVPGENALCLRFSDALPAQSGNGQRVSALVGRIQLP